MVSHLPALREISDSADSQQDAPQAAPSNIPPETWAMLQEAGHSAAERLRDLLQSSSFARLKPGDQARLIELALNRAYGPPIKREMSLTLTGEVSDATSQILASLAERDLPEIGSKGSG